MAGNSGHYYHGFACRQDMVLIRDQEISFIE